MASFPRTYQQGGYKLLNLAGVLFSPSLNMDRVTFLFASLLQAKEDDRQLKQRSASHRYADKQRALEKMGQLSEAPPYQDLFGASWGRKRAVAFMAERHSKGRFCL